MRAADGSPALIDPLPPRVRGLPWVGAGLGLLRAPTEFLIDSRERYGDTFALDAFGYRVLFVFSPEGVKNLWALPEQEASKTFADFALLRHKVPDELFAGRRTFPHGLFGRDDIEVYLENLRTAVALELDELGATGEIEAFAWSRRISHRLGLASWGGLEAASPRYLDRLVASLDRLDSSESFVHPHRGFWTYATRKRAERAALLDLEAAFGEILAARARDEGRRGGEGDLFDSICDSWNDVADPERSIGIARDVVLVHMASQSNLFAAVAWTLIHLLERPALLERVREGDEALLDACAHESIRLRQRSIVLRQILQPTSIADEKTRYDLAPGAYLATMMSVTNTSALPGLDEFEPANYERPVFGRTAELPARELVTTFGHGHHSCPAMRFSISAIRHSVLELIRAFELEARFRDPQPLRRQIGGVARASGPVAIGYRRR